MFLCRYSGEFSDEKASKVISDNTNPQTPVSSAMKLPCSKELQAIFWIFTNIIWQHVPTSLDVLVICGLSNSVAWSHSIRSGYSLDKCFNKVIKENNRFRTKLFSRKKPFPFGFWPSFVLPFSSSRSVGLLFEESSFLWWLQVERRQYALFTIGTFTSGVPLPIPKAF